MAATWFAYDYITVGRFIVSTDDAYVGADMAIIAPKIAANVAEVPIVENQAVKQGDVLVRLDDGDFQLAVSQAVPSSRRSRPPSRRSTHRSARRKQPKIRCAPSSRPRRRRWPRRRRTTSAPSRWRISDYTSKATLDAAIAARDTSVAQAEGR